MGKPSSYHHPALRAALLKAAAAELRGFGIRGFSLRRIALRAKVSHTAPYRHFHDRDEILAALVGETREELASAMRAAARKGGGSAHTTLSHMLEAYLAFASANPDRLSLVFSETGLAAMAKHPAPPGDSERYDAFGVLETAVKKCQAEGHLDPESAPGALSILVWSIMHGLSAIEREGYLEFMGRNRGLAAKAVRRLVLDAFDSLVSRDTQPKAARAKAASAKSRK